MYLEIGPASLVMEGEKKGTPAPLPTEPLEGVVREILTQISEQLPVLRLKAWKIRNYSHLPPVARRMVTAVKSVSEETLTPMAAVAGAVSDEIRDWLKGEGFDRISVNNGGDISVHGADGRPFRIAVGNAEEGEATPWVLTVASLTDYGIATSGFGGRSLTLGVADTVTVVSRDGATADAAATFIGNRTSVESPWVKRKKGHEVDPGTDIPDDLVTVERGKLSGGEIVLALDQGMEAARTLKERQIIYDALAIVQGRMKSTINGDTYITLGGGSWK